MSDFEPGLSEALAIARSGRGGAGPMERTAACTMCIVIEHATPGVSREALISASAGRISGRALHRSLRQIGIQISREAIDNHRNEAHQP